MAEQLAASQQDLSSVELANSSDFKVSNDGISLIGSFLEGLKNSTRNLGQYIRPLDIFGPPEKKHNCCPQAVTILKDEQVKI